MQCMILFLFFSLCFQRSKCDSFGKVEHILNGHRDRVNCVKWIPRPEYGNFFSFFAVLLHVQVLVLCMGRCSIASCFLVNKYMIYSDILRGGRVVGTCTYRCICCWNTSFTSLQFPNLPKNSFLDLSECINKLAVCFLLGAESELVSGSSDKLVIVWKKTASQDCKVSYMDCL